MGKEFTGDTPYFIMFGPDICGGKKKVHVIIWHNGTNHMIKEEIRAKSDELTHLYTLYINPKNEYKARSWILFISKTFLGFYRSGRSKFRRLVQTLGNRQTQNHKGQ